MRILMVAIPNHHFFQWVNQLEHSGYDVYWFDITGGGLEASKIPWVKQRTLWKLRWDFPFRTRFKQQCPKLYENLLKLNERNVTSVFETYLKKIKPDIIHCFEMQLSGLPILSVLEQSKIPLIYSSWGSDVFYYKELGIETEDLKRFYNRVDYLITDCKRDFKLVTAQGYKNAFLGVFPGNGGITANRSKVKPVEERNIILIKGYDDGVGKASVVLEALEYVFDVILQSKQRIVVYSADATLKLQIETSEKLRKLPITLHSRYAFIKNKALLELMGQSSIHIANSISDGMPNALLEAMYMGAFPIQSNPGGVTEELITHAKNGYLITKPLNAQEIAQHIKNALQNKELRKSTLHYNLNLMENHYNRVKLRSKIVSLYNRVDSE